MEQYLFQILIYLSTFTSIHSISQVDTSKRSTRVRFSDLFLSLMSFCARPAIGGIDLGLSRDEVEPMRVRHARYIHLGTWRHPNCWASTPTTSRDCVEIIRNLDPHDVRDKIYPPGVRVGNCQNGKTSASHAPPIMERVLTFEGIKWRNPKRTHERRDAWESLPSNNTTLLALQATKIYIYQTI